MAMKKLIFLILLPVMAFASLAGDLTKPSSESAREQSFHQFFELFDKNPSAASALPPAKFDSSGDRITHPKKYFSDTDIRNKSFIKIKNDLRRKITQTNRFFALTGSNNDVSTFFTLNTTLLKNISDFSQENLNQFTLTRQPWSGDYWGTYKGGIGIRYADIDFPFSFDFNKNLDYFKTYWPLDYKNAEALDLLSPAEKYDLLTGDTNFTLTKAAWQEGLKYNEAYGKIPTWFGICDGWSGSSLVLPRPQKSFQVPVLTPAGDTVQITFYPNDLKALASSLWAKGFYEHSFVGGRCDQEKPKRDSSGRLTDADCFDINPTALHLLLINRLHLADKGFVMDANFDSEVWNHPVIGYDLVYFNPQTKERSKNPRDVMIKYGTYTNDKFKKYRKKSVKSIIGVDVKISYVTESSPRHLPTDSPENDNLTSVQYMYDLEIDQKDNIIGGEWYQNAHPDFIWAPKGNSKAVSSYEHYTVGDWDGNAPISKTWLPYVQRASLNSQPFAKIVEKLFELSQEEGPE